MLLLFVTLTVAAVAFAGGYALGYCTRVYHDAE